MFLLILAIILAIAGFVATTVINTYRKSEASEDGTYTKISFPRYIGLALALICIIGSCVTTVPTGYTGILTTFGRVESKTISAGVNFIAPWQKVVKMDNRLRCADTQYYARSPV